MFDASMATVSQLTASAIALPNLYWSTAVASFGTVPAILITAATIVGIFVIGRYVVSWIINRFKDYRNAKKARKLEECARLQLLQQQQALLTAAV